MTDTRPRPAGVVSEVLSESPAEAAGIAAGDRIISINGKPILDVLDYQFYSAELVVDVVVERDSIRRTVRLEPEDGLGIRFAEPTFDGIHRCNNKCPFCFVHQNPRQARKTMFIKDDDYRYSAMYGGFVTLTNLAEDDWVRIGEQRLSPLNVSVHATEPEVRRLALGNAKAPDVMPQLRRLIDMGITVHTQVVLCPGINDGIHLDRTIADLSSLYPGAQTLSIVPVGLTNNGIRTVTETRRHTPEECREVLDSLGRYRSKFRREFGVSFVHPSDEFYLLAGTPLPGAGTYDGFPQYSNGVGMVRSLLDEAAGFARRRVVPKSKFPRVTLVTGTLAAPVLATVFEPVADRLGCKIEVVPIVNNYFGPLVTVAGLLSGEDIVNSLRTHDLGDLILLPKYALDVMGARFLDDVQPSEAEELLGRPIAFASNLSEALAAIT